MKLPSAVKSRSRPARSGRVVAGWMVRLAVAGLALVSLTALRLAAQDAPAASKTTQEETSLGHVKDFAVPDYYDPPNQNQIKSLLRGAEAEPQANGGVLIKGLQLETYNTNGSPVMIVRAPDCTYTYNQGGGQTASSSNHVEASSADGKLYIEGEGFRWEQTNSVFVISNNVHTTILSDTNSAP